MTKLAVNFTEQAPKVLTIPMDRAKWFAIADANNARRSEKMQRGWYRHEMEDLWAELHA